MFRFSTLASFHFGRHDADHLLMAICFAYFDASGNPFEPNRRQLTVAGYVGLERNWDRFARRWEAVLSKYGVDSFHANKMAQWAAPYNTWIKPDGSRDDAKRVAYLQDLTKAIKPNVFKAFSQSIFLDDYDRVNAEFELDTICRPYGLCGAQIVKNCYRWMRKAHPDHNVLFAFEKGDADQSDLERVLDRQGFRIPYPPQFIPKRWKEANGTTQYLRPFEAGDLWAYEDALALPQLKKPNKTRGTARGSFIHISEQIPYERKFYNEHGLKMICGALNAKRR